MVNRVFRGYVDWIDRIGVAKLTVRNAERLSGPGPHLVVANHPTLLDVVMIGRCCPRWTAWPRATRSRTRSCGAW